MAEKTVKVIGNELYHFGIPGQKWYKRRYQNEDGTYTEEGKERRRTGSDDYKRAKELSKKGVKNLSNKELQELNNRQNLESQFKRNNMSFGARFVDQYKGQLVSAIVSAAVTATMLKGKNFVNKFKE